MKTGELLLDFKDAHLSWVFHIQMDCAKIVSSSQDRKIIVWDFSGGIDVEQFM
jgi:hypothetical protein